MHQSLEYRGVSSGTLLQEGPSKEKAKLNSQAVAGETVFILLESRMERKRTVPYSAPPFLAVRLEFLYTDWQRIGPLVDTPNFDHKASEPVVELVHISFSSNFSGHFSVATQEKNFNRYTMYLFCTFSLYFLLNTTLISLNDVTSSRISIYLRKSREIY